MVTGVVGQGLSIYEALRKSVATTRAVEADTAPPVEAGDNGTTPVRAKEAH